MRALLGVTVGRQRDGSWYVMEAPTAASLIWTLPALTEAEMGPGVTATTLRVLPNSWTRLERQTKNRAALASREALDNYLASRAERPRATVSESKAPAFPRRRGPLSAPRRLRASGTSALALRPCLSRGATTWDAAHRPAPQGLSHDRVSSMRLALDCRMSANA